MKSISGTIYSYYHLCPKKAWYASRDLTMEDQSENVALGALIDENSYSRERKHVMIDDTASIDFLRDGTVYEVKKSTREKDMAIAQIKYYLYILSKKGMTDMKGELRVPMENYIETVTLCEEEMREIELKITKIQNTLASLTAPKGISRPRVCSKCAYFDLCKI